MNIRFTVGSENYQLTADKYNVILNKVGTAETGKNIGSETFSLVGYYPNEFNALESLVDGAVITEDLTSFVELAVYRRMVLNDINAVIKQYKLSE